ncbi:NAD(P)-dependent oxidoreductase [uncultured Anaerococcus sp.]|uniref:NAD-dependent epimerase/dehydratase family protein n=1 Tax=uncultured Anaerococcus sp. TaxID=293428 RepID=UPI002889FE76|nr:NAD(P)-dependent oxidoreductase [uncultured Anaerococcus sp.]
MKNIRKIFILGGANLFARELIKYGLDQGYKIKAVDLIKSSDIEENENLEYVLADFFALGDKQAMEMIGDCDSFVYAGGIDDLVVPRKPAGKFFYERNVLPTGRIARLAKKAGIRNFLLLGDYRSEIAEKNQILRKNNYHHEPYIETRLMQESIAIFEGDGLMNVSILRPGLIVGKSNKNSLAAHIDLVRANTTIPVTEGVIPIISAKALAQGAIFALELENHKKTYALATGNISYKDLYEKILEIMKKTDGKSLVSRTFDDLLEAYEEDQKITERKNLEHGISQVNMLRAMTMDLSLKGDFDLGDEDLEEEIGKMIDLYLNGSPVKA